MNRLVSGTYAESIGCALTLLPEGVRDLLRHVEFLTGTDPVFAGLHDHVTSDGFPLAELPHCAYQHHTHDGTTTIVLPVPEQPWVVTHELGHALDEVMGFTMEVVPVSDYALINRQEAFAESFVAWLWWDGDQDAFASDRATRAFLAGIGG